MKRILASLSVLLFGCTSVPEPASSLLNKLTAQEAREGWQLLFDGKSVAGWHTYGKRTIGKAWEVAEGSLHFNPAIKSSLPDEGGDIVTDKEYEHFHLKLEWKVAPNGNSGIFFFVKEDPARFSTAWMSGPEMQVLDNNGHPDAQFPKHRAGDLYDLIAAREASRPAGEWNAAEIIADKGQLRFLLNGQTVLETRLWDAAWQALIADSKFKTYHGFGSFTKGSIALQDHGDPVWFRNIKLKVLP